MNTNGAWKFVFPLFLIFLLIACSTPPTQPTIAPAPTNAPQVDMPNPASVYCTQQGNKLEIRTAADGSQSGVCIFPVGSECDEWAYYRGECGPTPPVTETPIVPTQTSTGGIVIPQGNPMPAGAIIDPRPDRPDPTEGLISYNTDGLVLGELLAPHAAEIHAAGHYPGSLSFPLVFHSFELESQEHGLYLNSGSSPANPGGQVSLLAPLDSRDMLSGLVGVPGEPVLFYIVFQPIDTMLQSRFFIGDIDSITAAPPILTIENNESSYCKPVSIHMQDGAPDGLWFTRTPWGIGGEIVFEYNEGLSYFNLASGTITEVLPPEARFSSLSVDQTWVAYSLRKETGSEFFILDLRGGEPILLPALLESDRGAGNGVFSPSNQYIAWREAQGSYFDGNFHQTIRIATLDGRIVGEFKDVPFYKTAEFTDGMEVKPLGWLDDENLLVQVVAPEKPGGRGAVVKLDATTGQFTLFAPGFFAGWFYP